MKKLPGYSNFEKPFEEKEEINPSLTTKNNIFKKLPSGVTLEEEDVQKMEEMAISEGKKDTPTFNKRNNSNIFRSELSRRKESGFGQKSKSRLRIINRSRIRSND